MCCAHAFINVKNALVSLEKQNFRAKDCRKVSIRNYFTLEKNKVCQSQISDKIGFFNCFFRFLVCPTRKKDLKLVFPCANITYSLRRWEGIPQLWELCRESISNTGRKEALTLVGSNVTLNFWKCFFFLPLSCRVSDFLPDQLDAILLSGI